MDIYIKPSKKASLYEQEWVYVKDVCEVFVGKPGGQGQGQEQPIDYAAKIENIKLLKTGNKKKAFLITVLDIVKEIDAAFNGSTITNIGETDTLVEFSPTKPKQIAFLKWLKVAFIVTVLFVGSSTAIMSFHTDSDIPKVFQNYYKIFLDKESDKPYWISIPYSFGLTTGIIVFFNHFAGRKLTNDPTPIEVQMKIYEKDVTDTKVSALSAMKERNADVEKKVK